MKETKFAQYYFLQSLFLLPVWKFVILTRWQKTNPFAPPSVCFSSDWKANTWMAKYLPRAMRWNDYSHIKILSSSYLDDKKMYCNDPDRLLSFHKLQDMALMLKQWPENKLHIHIITSGLDSSDGRGQMRCHYNPQPTTTRFFWCWIERKTVNKSVF